MADIKSLEDKIQASGGNPATMLQNSPIGRYVYPIPAEFSNWMDEQRAWRETAVLFDQSFHMTDLYVKGPDVKKLLSHVGVNSFEKFGRDKAKQLVCCNYDGYVIGDCILFGLEDDEVNIVGRPPVPNWVQFHAETGGFDVTVERDERSVDDPNKLRKTFRYEVQGPNAMKILEAVNQGGPLTTKFFNMGEITIDGVVCRTLAHGMGGAPGLELWGPVEHMQKVKAALLAAGEPHGLKQAGARAYSTVATESGWMPAPLQAVYSGEKMRPYREWLSAKSFDAVASIGGSFQSDNVVDYYLTPWDLDYHRVIKFDHDFIGRDALAKMVDQPHRTKVTMVWDKADVLAIYAGLMEEGEMPKLMEMPAAHYAAHPYDKVVSNGKTVGISTYPIYSANERAWLSLAVIDEGYAEMGNRLEIVWGEADGGTAKPVVERHRQVNVGAEIHPWPIHEAYRRTYRATS